VRWLFVKIRESVVLEGTVSIIQLILSHGHLKFNAGPLNTRSDASSQRCIGADDSSKLHACMRIAAAALAQKIYHE
jgi:hypothetical protein